MSLSLHYHTKRRYDLRSAECNVSHQFAVRTAIAVICLTGPSLYLSLAHFQEYGLRIEGLSTRLLLPTLGAALLVAHVMATVSGRWAEILAGDFFPSKGFLFFLVSGFAYGLAIFPGFVAEQGRTVDRRLGRSRRWLIAVPAWIWILLLILIATLGHP